MKKLIMSLTIFVVLLSFFGCKTGDVTRLPEDAIAVGRTISGDDVILEIDPDTSLMDDNEIIIIAEKLPDGVSFVEDSFSVDPMFSSDQVAAWLFAKNPKQALGSLTIEDALPSTITYSVEGTAEEDSEFRGKWGLKIAEEEGLFEEEGGGSDACYSDKDCSGTQFCDFYQCIAETGKCIDVPELLIDLWEPVCGCDGVTYPNDVDRKIAKVSKEYDGECGVTNEYDLNGDGFVNLNDIIYVLENWKQGVLDINTIIGVLEKWSG